MTPRMTFLAAALFAVLAAVPALARKPPAPDAPAVSRVAASDLPTADAPQDADAAFDLLFLLWAPLLVIGGLMLLGVAISVLGAFRRWVFWGALGLSGRAFDAPPHR